MIDRILHDLWNLFRDPSPFSFAVPVLIPPAAFLLGLILDLTVRKSRRRAPTGKWFKRYTDRAHTPMGWHWFMLFVVLPLPAIEAGDVFIRWLINPKDLFLYIPFASVPILAAELAWMCLSYAAFRRRSMAGAYFLAAQFFAGLLYGVVMFLDIDAKYPGYWTGYEGGIYLNLEWLAVTLLYYHRRAPLFSPDAESPAQAQGPCPE